VFFLLPHLNILCIIYVKTALKVKMYPSYRTAAYYLDSHRTGQQVVRICRVLSVLGDLQQKMFHVVQCWPALYTRVEELPPRLRWWSFPNDKYNGTRGRRVDCRCAVNLLIQSKNTQQAYYGFTGPKFLFAPIQPHPDSDHAVCLAECL